MAVEGKVFAVREPAAAGNKRNGAEKQLDFSEIACTEFGTLPRETIIRLGLRHVYMMPVVLEDDSTVQVPIYRAEVLWRKQGHTVYVQESVARADELWHKLPEFVSPSICWCRDFLRAVKRK